MGFKVLGLETLNPKPSKPPLNKEHDPEHGPEQTTASLALHYSRTMKQQQELEKVVEMAFSHVRESACTDRI